MANSQGFLYAYDVTVGANGAITISPKNPKGGITVSDTIGGTDTSVDNLAVLGDLSNDGVTVQGLNNTNSKYIGTAVVNGGYGILVADQNNKTVFISNLYLPPTGGDVTTTYAANGTWTLAGTGTAAAPTGVTLATDTGASATDRVTSVATIKGVAAAGSTVTLTIGGTAVGSAMADGSGNFSITPTSGLVQGTNTVSVTATGDNGVASPATSISFTYDTAAPGAPAIGGVTDDVAPNTGTVAINGATNDTTPTVTGTAEAGATVSVYNGTTLLGTTAAAAGGQWTFTPTTPLADGTYTFTAKATDAAGNQGPASAAAYTVKVDTTAPAAPSITAVTDDAGAVTGAVAANGRTDDTTPTVTVSLSNTGAVEGDTVRLLADGASVGSATLSATDISNGSVKVTSSALSGDGAKVFTATVTDAAGNASTASAGTTVVLDTTAPTVSSVAASGTGITAGGDGALNAGKVVTFTVNASEALTVTGTPALTLNNTATATYVGGSGTNALTFRYTVAAGQDTGDLAVTGLNLNGGSVRDAAGNPLATVSANPVGTLRIDTAAPGAPSALALASDTGASATDKITSDPTVKGTAEAGATVTLTVGATVVGTGTADGSGNFSIAPTSGLVQGSNTVSVTATDAAGNTGSPSSLTFTYDTAAPAVTSIAASGTGITIGGDGSLGAGKTVVLTVNAGEALTVTGTPTLTLNNNATATYTGGSGTGALTFAYTVAAGQDTAELKVTALNLPGGAAIRDAAGNAVTFNAANAGDPAGVLRIDTAAPAAPTSLALASDTGASATDKVTSDPTVKGTAEVGSTVTLKVGATVVGTGTADGSGNFSITPTGLAQGQNTVSATATDAAGNTGAAGSVTFTYDTAAPSVSSVAASGAGITNGDGALNAGKAVTFTVTAGEALTVTGIPSLTLNNGATAAYSAGSGTGTISFRYTVAANQDTADLSVTGLNLNGGTVTDAAGNPLTVAATNPAGTLRIDTAAPGAPTITGATDDVAPNTGAVGNGGATNDTTPTLSGTAEANSTVAVFDGSTQLGTTTANGSGAWSFTPTTALAQGAHSLSAKATDAAGNQGAASATYTVTVDTTAPGAPSISSVTDDQAPQTGVVAAGGATNDATPIVRVSLSGTAAVAGDTVQVLANGSAAGAAVALTASNITAGYVDVTAALSGDGAKSLTATVTDAAGNASTASGGVGVVLDTAAPAAPTISDVSDNVGTAQGTVASGGATDDATLTLTGTAEAGAAVNVYNGTVLVGTATAGANGAWSLTTSALPEGAVSLTARATDAAGNQGAASTAFIVTVDTTAPNAPSISGVTDNVGAVQGAVAPGAASDDATPTVAISLSGTGAVAGDVVRLLANGAQVGAATLTASDISAGTVSITSSALSGDGAKALTATVTDAVGNASAASAGRTVVLDTSAPAAPIIGGVTDDAAPNTGTVAANGATNDTTPTLTGTAEAGAAVSVYNGTALLGTTTAAGDGKWSFTPTTALADGAYTFTAKAADAAGNQGGASTAYAVTVDTKAPAAPTIGSVSDDAGPVQGQVQNGGATDDTTLTLTGTAEAGATVGVYNGATLVGTATAAGDGSWSVTTSALPAGTASLTAKAADAAGNQGAASGTFTATVITAAPGTPTSVALVQDTGTAGDNVTSNPAIKGVVDPNATVTLKVGSTVVGTGTADAQGNFAITPTGLAQGQNTVSVAATNAAGNTGAATNLTFTLDSAAPGAPTVGTVGDNVGLTQGNLASGAATDDTTLTLTGTAEANATVQVFNGATLVGTATAAGDGSWSLTTSTLPEGAVSLTAKATDAAGNTSAASAAFAATVDTTAPGNTTTLALSSDTGASSTDRVTSNPALSGTVSGTTTGLSVTILEGTTVVGTAAIGANGAWTFANASATDGAHTYTAAVTDAAGNNGTASAALSATVDKAAPAAPTIGSVTDDSGAVQGTLASGASTDDATLSLAGTAEANSTVQILNGATVLGTATANNSGDWTFTTPALSGSVSLTARATDAAGNQGPASPAFTATIDTTAPNAPAITGVTDDAGAVQGAVAPGAASDDTTPTVAISLSGTGAAAGDTLALFANGAQVASRTLTATDIANGSASLTSSALSGDGAKALTATVTDAAGNASAASAGRTVVLDTAAPAAPAITAVADDAGAIKGDLSSGAATDDTTLALTGTAEANATVAVFNGAARLGTTTADANGAWSFATPALSDGPVSLTVRATDAAGNQGPASAAFAATVDTRPPAVTSVAASGPGITDGDGALNAGSTVILTVSASEALTVTGAPTLALNNGGTATYTGGSGTGALTFAYTVAAGQDTADLAATGLNLPNGAAVRDAAGNAVTFDAAGVGNPAGILAIDTVAPGAPTIGGATDNAGAKTGPVADGGATDDATLTLAGTAAAGATVTVYGNGTTVVATATADGSGNWTATTSALPDGAVSLTARATDAAGNQGPASAAFTATVDTSAPAAPAGLALAADTGASATDRVTSDPTIKGTAEAGATVTLTVGSTVVGTGTADESGDFSITPTGLGQGQNTVAVTATDAAGNTGAASSITFTYDSEAPTAAPTVRLVSDTGTAGDGVTSNPALTGTAPANATVVVKDGAAVLGTATATADGSGDWSFTPTGAAAADGAHDYTAQVSDTAGNLGPAGATSPATVTVDTTAPAAAPAIVSVTDDAGPVTGAVVPGGSTDDATPTVELSLAGTGAAAGDTVALYADGVRVASHVLTASDLGAGSVSLTAAALSGDGAKELTAKTIDAAGNASAPSGSVGIVLDTAAPTETTTVALASDTGASAGDGVTSDPALTGAVSSGASGATVTVFDNGAAIGTAVTGANGAWSFANASATEGAHSYTAAVTDAAGNSGPASDALPATIDRAADADVAVDLKDATASANGASVAFDLAGLDAGSTAEVTFAGSAGGSVTRAFSANGAQTADVSGLAGDVTATVRVADAAGNTAAGQGDTLAADPVCFMPGTLVATPEGERAVEALRAGDLVLTADGRAAPVRWLGRQTVSTRFADPLRVLPIRIAAGALGENLPARDLLVSADHALLVDGVLVQAGALVNGTTVRREAAVPEVFTYWHVELADHSLVLAEGVPAETFIDNVARLAFDNWDEHEAAGSEAPIAEMALPRAKSHRQVPQATRRRLAERAELLLGAAATAA